MNITDYKATPFNKETWLDEIFEKQALVMEKYAKIEKMPKWPLNVNTRLGQKWFKDFLWRVSEELSESYEAYTLMEDTHMIEELADALHFFVELLILAGFDSKWAKLQLQNAPELNLSTSTDSAYLDAHFRLGMIGNTLKNKPWKQTEMLTDEKKFEKMTSMAFIALLKVFHIVGADDETIHSFYTRKNQVNQFRQRSAY